MGKCQASVGWNAKPHDPDCEWYRTRYLGLPPKPKTPPPTPYVVLVGSPSDGFSVLGTFPTSNGAIHWAQSEVKVESWWVVPVLRP